MLLTFRSGLNNPPQAFDSPPGESRWIPRRPRGWRRSHDRKAWWPCSTQGTPHSYPGFSHMHQPQWAVTRGANKCYCFKPPRFTWQMVLNNRRGRMQRNQPLGDLEQKHVRQRKQREPRGRAGRLRNWQQAGGLESGEGKSNIREGWSDSTVRWWGAGLSDFL